MRLYISIVFLLFFIVETSFSQQNVGIGTVSPHPSSLLDLESTTKGLLIPRMSTSERQAISKPVSGLTIYDKDCGEYWYYYEAGSDAGWVSLNNSGNKILEITKDTSLSICDQTVIANVNSISTITITLPVASNVIASYNKGKIYIIKLINQDPLKTKQVVIKAQGIQTIDGFNSFIITDNYKSITIQSDGFNWWIINK